MIGNPMQMMGMIMNSKNPQQMVMNMMKGQANNNPMLSNLLKLAESGNTQQIEQIARNILKEQGKDFDKEFAGFKQTYGL